MKKFEETVLRYYKSIKQIKADASRCDSAEKFLLTKEFKGFENVTKSNQINECKETEIDVLFIEEKDENFFKFNHCFVGLRLILDPVKDTKA